MKSSSTNTETFRIQPLEEAVRIVISHWSYHSLYAYMIIYAMSQHTHTLCLKLEVRTLRRSVSFH